ncbi:MAG: DUF4058 family protein [Chloroflexota bacterium]
MSDTEKTYIDVLTAGPFIGRLDPFAEQARYFHQIHGGMIGNLQAALRPELVARGYKIGREASLQIAAGRVPDLFVTERVAKPQPTEGLVGYKALASQIEMNEGIALSSQKPDLDALYITEIGSRDLVTVIEVISPHNKNHTADRERYLQQRNSLFLQQGINVVEIDATRSVMRLIPVVEMPPDALYHTTVFVSGDVPHAIPNGLEHPLQPFALPLRGEAVRVEPHTAYTMAYIDNTIPIQLLDDDQYEGKALPFPSTLTAEQKVSVSVAVQNWWNRLVALREENS